MARTKATRQKEAKAKMDAKLAKKTQHKRTVPDKELILDEEVHESKKTKTEAPTEINPSFVTFADAAKKFIADNPEQSEHSESEEKSNRPYVAPLPHEQQIGFYHTEGGRCKTEVFKIEDEKFFNQILFTCEKYMKEDYWKSGEILNVYNLLTVSADFSEATQGFDFNDVDEAWAIVEHLFPQTFRNYVCCTVTRQEHSGYILSDECEPPFFPLVTNREKGYQLGFFNVIDDVQEIIVFYIEDHVFGKFLESMCNGLATHYTNAVFKLLRLLHQERTHIRFLDNLVRIAAQIPRLQQFGPVAKLESFKVEGKKLPQFGRNCAAFYTPHLNKFYWRENE